MNFASDLQKLIDNTYDDTWNKFEYVKSNARLYKIKKSTINKWITLGEPAFVAQLASEPFARRQLTKLIQRHLSPTISKGMPLVSGVFVHQKPKVKFGNSASEVELGDILFVRHHFSSNAKSPEGRAFLLQVKSTLHPMTGSLKEKEAKQFDLYADWNTDFTFPHGDLGKAPSGKKWNLSKGPSPYVDTGFYGLVSNDRKFATAGFPDRSAWAVGAAFAPPVGMDKQVVASASLAQALHSFLIGSEGRPWYLGSPKTDHWSNFVEQILKKSLLWTTRLKRIQEIDMPRQFTALSFANTFALANAYSDAVNFRLARSDDSQMSYFLRTLDETKEIEEQSKKWVSSGGDARIRDGEPKQTDYEVLKRDSGGMSVLSVWQRLAKHSLSDSLNIQSPTQFRTGFLLVSRTLCLAL